MTRPTHANIDKAIHAISVIEDADGNSAHSHRVRFACGLAFDLRGERQFQDHAATLADMGTSEGGDERSARDAKNKIDAAYERLHAAVADYGAAEEGSPEWHERAKALDIQFRGLAEAHEAWHAAQPRDKRWLTHADAAPVKATCARCAAFERGEREAVPPPKVERRVRLPDIPTGLPCPECGTQIRIRRSDGTAACEGGGHDYTIEEVQKTAFAVLSKLAKGEFFPKEK